MKVTESDTRREIVSVFDVEGGPVLPMKHSTIDRKYRVEKVKVTYKFSTEKNAWIVQSGFHVELSGTVQMIKPGLAALSVETAKVGRIALPQGMIPRLVKEIDNSRRPEGLPDNALALQVPGYVGDIRIGNGKVTLYKNVQ